MRGEIVNKMLKFKFQEWKSLIRTVCGINTAYYTYV